MNTQSTNLTRRSLLNTVGALLVYLVFLGAGFVSKKYLVVFLGPVAFGAWEICYRLLNYVSPGEGPVSQTLKWILANKGAVVDTDGLKRYIGGAFILWACLILPILLVGGGIAWLSPRFINDLPPGLVSVVQWASFIIVIGLLAETWSRLYLGVLQGSNLLYKATWATSFFHILGMVLMITAAYHGFGLGGMAVSLIITSLISGATYLRLVKSWVPWFGLEKPRREELKELLSLGSWMYAWSFVSRLLFLSDLVIVGMVQGALAVTTLTFTQYAPHVGIYLAAMATTAVAPGLGRILGEGDFFRVKAVREELAAIIWILIIVAGVCILAWNRTLVTLWVGADKFAGWHINLLLVLIFGQMAFIRMEAFIIDVSLKVKPKVFWGLASAILSIFLAYFMGRQWGMAGVLVGLLLGRGILTIVYPILVGRLIRHRGFVPGGTTIRLAAVSVVILGITHMLAKDIRDVGWIGLFGYGFLTAAIAFLVAFFVGFNAQIRARLWLRASRAGIFKRFLPGQD